MLSRPPCPSPTRPSRPMVVMAVCVLSLLGAAKARAEAPRAKPPEFSKADRAPFFDDARAMLVGPRPDFVAGAVDSRPRSNTTNKTPAVNGFAWSQWVSTDTLETEIKRQSRQVTTLTLSASKFKGGGYRECRDALSTLAVMFAISAEHDDDARWRDRAAGLAMRFDRAAANCKVGTDNSFREASASGEDLADLVRGGRPSTPRAEPGDDWDGLADRSPLMRRIESALQDRLGPLTADKRSWRRGADDALHEAQVLAALSEVLTRKGLEDAGDEEYDRLARKLRDAAADLAAAAEQEDYGSVRDAFGRANKACSECHDLYRG